MGTRWSALFMACAAAAVVVASALGATPSRIVANLNAQRVANGIPGGIKLDSVATRGCEAHIRCEELNGIGYTHVETKGKPGYTTAGVVAAAESDLADTGGWDSVNPFEDLPLHLANLLEPRLAKVGAYASGARSCISIVGGNSRQFTKNQVFTYPAVTSVGCGGVGET